MFFLSFSGMIIFAGKRLGQLSHKILGWTIVGACVWCMYMFICFAFLVTFEILSQ